MRDSDPTGRLGHPKFVCAHCSRVFTRYPSAVKHDPPKYCGRECSTAHRRIVGFPTSKPRVKVVCRVCGKAEMVAPSTAKGRKFCSQSCMLVWRGPVLRDARRIPEARETKRCETCGDEFETHKCRAKDGRGRFCSRGCAAAWTIRNQARSVSGAEKRFCDALTNAGLEFQTQFRVGRWTIDIVFEPEMLAVEYDGDYWHSLPSSIKRDARKDADLRKKGFTVLRIPERMHKYKPSDAVNAVAQHLLRIRKGLENAS